MATASTAMTMPKSASSQRAPRRSSSSSTNAEQETMRQPACVCVGGWVDEQWGVRARHGWRTRAGPWARHACAGGGPCTFARASPSPTHPTPACTPPRTCPQRHRAVGEHVEGLGAAHRLLDVHRHNGQLEHDPQEDGGAARPALAAVARQVAPRHQAQPAAHALEGGAAAHGHEGKPPEQGKARLGARLDVGLQVAWVLRVGVAMRGGVVGAGGWASCRRARAMGCQQAGCS